MAEELPIAIIGAGLSGLLLAQGLKKSPIPFAVYEAETIADYSRSREWGMSIQWGLAMLPDLLPDEIMAGLKAACCDPYFDPPDVGCYMTVYNGETGEHIKDIPLVKFLRVSRSKTRKLLTTGLDVQYAKAFRSADFTKDKSTVLITFEDGTSTTARLLVAADGANSAVRRSLFPDDKGISQQIGYTGVNMHVCYKDASVATLIRKSLGMTQCLGSHPRGYWLWLSIQDVPDPDDPMNWAFQLQWTWKTGPKTESLATFNLENLQAEAAECFGEPFRTAWLSIPQGTKVPANAICVWHPLPISDEAFDGRAALVGDTAHAMSFHRGQGLNHGIADACKLADELVKVFRGDKSQKDAVLAYEAEMVKRAGEEVELGKMNTEMMHDWDRMKDSVFMQRGGDKNK